MAGASVPQEVLERLTETIIKLADNWPRNGEGWINENLRWMRELCGRIEALNQVPGNADDLVEKIRMVIRRSEDVKDTSKKMESQMRRGAVYEKAKYLIERRDVKREIKEIKTDTINAVKQLQLPLKYNFTISDDLVMPRRVSPVSEVNVDYRNIPFYLRQCIYYFLLFPAEYEIPARRLIALWVAEGLVSPADNDEDNESAEQVAGHYLDELIALNVISVKRKLNGNVKSCQLTDSTQREILLEMAKDARFFHFNAGLISRLVDHNGSTSRDSCFIRINGKRTSPASISGYRKVLSLLSFNTQEGSKPGEDIGDFVDKCISAGCFRLMRVLDLERVFRPKLPKALSKLTLLRYLGLRWTYLENLPDFVNKLFNLQVLDVKHTYISILPKSIWRMQYLRHLYLSETYGTRFDGRPISQISLNDLQTLWGAFVDEDTCVADGLDTLLKIRKLGLSCRPTTSSENSDRMSQQLKAVDEWISRLDFLETLRLKSRDEDGRASDLHLSSNSLSRKENLSALYLLGRLQQSVVLELPANLIDITLSGSELGMDPMLSLGKLPKLIILRLLSESVVHTSMLCERYSFPQLKVLYIWDLKNLEEWEAKEGSLPNLMELKIRLCKKLRKLPDQLQQVQSLQIKLTKMPTKFIDDVKGNQPEVWNKVELGSEDE